MFGLKEDWHLDVPPRYMTMEDYEGGEVRWCPGCGDHAVLTAVQRICRDNQLPPEKTVSVSGIGCSSRFPHYMGTFGFHSLHGRALPVACGVKARRPDLHVWVATGDGDCCSIGAGHWIHAIRYNMDMVVLLFDNAIYGLTKKQTSPTTPVGLKTNTHPEGAWLPPLNPTRATLGFTNASFVANTVDWNPLHLTATIRAGFHHKGTAFIRILQRCPTYTDNVFDTLQNDPDNIILLEHENGIPADPALDRLFKTRQTHDPSDMSGAMELALLEGDKFAIGLLFQDESRPMYDAYTNQGLGMSTEDRLAGLESELDRFGL